MDMREALVVLATRFGVLQLVLGGASGVMIAELITASVSYLPGPQVAYDCSATGNTVAADTAVTRPNPTALGTAIPRRSVQRACAAASSAAALA